MIIQMHLFFNPAYCIIHGFGCQFLQFAVAPVYQPLQKITYTNHTYNNLHIGTLRLTTSYKINHTKPVAPVYDTNVLRT